MTDYLKLELSRLNSYLRKQMNDSTGPMPGNKFFNYMAAITALVNENKELEEKCKIQQKAIDMLNSRIDDLHQKNLQPLVNEALIEYKRKLHYFIDNDDEYWED